MRDVEDVELQSLRSKCATLQQTTARPPCPAPLATRPLATGGGTEAAHSKGARWRKSRGLKGGR